jgi:hypothetical protein
MRLRILAPLLAVSALAGAAPALAHSIPVTSDAESGPGTLGHAILMAGIGDTIEVPAGEYPLTEGETLQAQHNVIRGAGADATTIVPTGGGEAIEEGVNVLDATVAPARNAAGAGEDSKIETQAQIIALIVTLGLFLLVLELVRRRRLAERYALLWIAAAIALLVLAIWTDGLAVLADAMGIQEDANAIFILAFGVIFFLLLHFSVATSRLAEETKILAQETARLEQELRVARGEIPGHNGISGSSEQPEHERPVGTQDGG